MLKTDLCISVCDIFFDIPLDNRVKRRYNKAIMMVQNILLSSESLTHDHWVFRDISVVFSRLYYIIDGEAYYEEGGQRIRLKKNHLYLTPVKTPFTLWENPKDKLFHTYSHITTLPAIDRFIEVEVKEGTPLYDAVALWRRYIHTESSAYLSKVIELILACLDLEGEGMITKEQALLMIDPKQLDALLHPQFDAKALKAAKPVASALPASPGAACGKIVFTAEDAVEWGKAGEKVVLVRLETSPEDIEGMHYSQGILTVRGGMTSHAAVVARGMGTCCVSGCGAIKMDEENKKFVLDGRTYVEGDYISLDGSTGNIYGEAIPTVPATIGGEFGIIMGWADEYRQLQVRTNADTPKDA